MWSLGLLTRRLSRLPCHGGKPVDKEQALQQFYRPFCGFCYYQLEATDSRLLRAALAAAFAVSRLG